MKCVWVKAWEGTERMGRIAPGAADPAKILDVQKPVDNALKGRSSWLRVVRMEKQVGEFAPKPAKAPAAAAKPAFAEKPAAVKPASDNAGKAA